ncbi:MAG: tetratricopeptide repeat protein [Thermoproteota archaeon]|nr:tetratricopeptide repeat protein [Thermoproteota archaeon]
MSRPNHIDTLYDKAFAHTNLGEWDEADNCYDEILKIDPNQARVIGDKGVVQASKGNYTEALDFFNKALKIESKNQRILKNREFALEKLKASSLKR